jgi:hypothetical protein
VQDYISKWEQTVHSHAGISRKMIPHVKNRPVAKISGILPYEYTPPSGMNGYKKEVAMGDGSKMIVMFVIILIICIFGAWWLNQDTF